MGYSATGVPSTQLRHVIRYVFESSGHQQSEGLPEAIVRTACESLAGQHSVAATAQTEFEEFILSIVEALLRHVGPNRVEGLVLSGGCGLNVLANQRIHDALSETNSSDTMPSFFEPVAPNDSGHSVGGVWALTPPLVRQPVQYLADYIYINIYIYTYIYIWRHIYIYICYFVLLTIHMYIYVYMYICIFISVY